MYLRLGTGWVHQVLAGHLNRLISPGKLSRVHEALLTCWTVGVWYSHQVGSLGTSTEVFEVHVLQTQPRHSKTRAILKRPSVVVFTCVAASVRPHRALEPALTESPKSGRLEFLALWEIPAMDSPRTCQDETRDRRMSSLSLYTSFIIIIYYNQLTELIGIKTKSHNKGNNWKKQCTQ